MTVDVVLAVAGVMLDVGHPRSALSQRPWASMGCREEGWGGALAIRKQRVAIAKLRKSVTIYIQRAKPENAPA